MPSEDSRLRLRARAKPQTTCTFSLIVLLLPARAFNLDRADNLVVPALHGRDGYFTVFLQTGQTVGDRVLRARLVFLALLLRVDFGVLGDGGTSCLRR